MRILLILAVTWFATTTVEGQTVLVHPSARSMPLRVFDATGKLMAGTVGVADPTEPMAVTFLYRTSTRKGDTFTLRIKAPLSDGPLGYYWAPLPIDTFYFESSDCSGPPYVESPGLMAGRRVAVLDTATNLLYLSEPKPTVVAIIYQSLRHPLDSCDVDVGDSILAVAVDPVLDMDTAFMQPFEVR